MEIPEIGIKQINVPEIYIPEIYRPDPVLPVITNLEIDVVGCTYQHRDIKNTGNTQLLLDDPNGVFLTCGESLFPSFYPIDYRPDQLVITEDLPITNDAPPMPETDIPKTETPKEKEEIKVEPCPPKDAPFMAGDYRNDKKIQRLVKYEKTIGAPVIRSGKMYHSERVLLVLLRFSFLLLLSVWLLVGLRLLSL